MKFSKTFIVFVLLSFTLLLAGYGMSEEINKETMEPLTVRELPEFRVTKGAVLYSRYCSFCHGGSGEGDGLNAFSIPVRPVNFNNRNLLAKKSDKELERVILLGGASQGLSMYMPAFGRTFSEHEAGHLIRYIRDFSSD